MAERELDVLVLGGGVVGAGTALDAVTRGLSTGLVEARDWASGTSSRSSKLIHGGLRYLEMLDFGLVREALKERGLLLEKLAPHLVRPVPFLYPLQHKGWERLYAGTGVALYDAMAMTHSHGRGLPVHRHLSRRHALRVAPCLKKDALVGALQYYDAQVDDARFVLNLVRTAAAYGARTANGTRVTGFLREGERVVGARVQDVEGGGEYEIRAKQVVNATGVWTDDTQAMVGERGQIHVRASKGIHLVVPKDRIHSSTGLILRTERSVLFVIPWGRHWIVGTTDTAWDLDKAHPAASSADIDYLLEHVNSVLAVPLTRDDVEGVRGPAPAARRRVGRHQQAVPRAHGRPPGPRPGRGRGRQVHDVPGDGQGRRGRRGARARPARGGLRHRGDSLVGAEGYHALWNGRARTAARTGLHPVRVEHLLQRYGSLSEEVLDLVASDPSLGEPLRAADDYLRAEVVYAASHEDARHLEDVLTRRTRISIETFDRGTRSAREAAELMAPVLGWDSDQIDREVQYYEKRVEAERESQRQPDDLTADAARLGAPDIVPL